MANRVRANDERDSYFIKHQSVLELFDHFGEPQDANFQDMPRRTFSNDSELEVGMVFSFADAAGGELPGVVDSFDEETVRVNFNHPLAGRTLKFEVKIDRVEPAELH